ncbi:hypothetical protein BDW02DRAFT_507021, partial [Decorospora gaudefroyi]
APELDQYGDCNWDLAAFAVYTLPGDYTVGRYHSKTWLRRLRSSGWSRASATTTAQRAILSRG